MGERHRFDSMVVLRQPEFEGLGRIIPYDRVRVFSTLARRYKSTVRGQCDTNHAVIMSSQEGLVVGVVEIAYYYTGARGVHVLAPIGMVM